MGFSAQCPFWSICTEFLSVLAKYTASATCEVNHYMHEKCKFPSRRFEEFFFDFLHVFGGSLVFFLFVFA